MSIRSANRYAVVADPRSLMRDLLRFLLEQEGFSVASEASTVSAALEAVAEHHPDVVILHETTAQDAPDAIARIREEAPDATVVVLTADRSSTPPSLSSAADAVVEEGAGLQDLASVLGAGAGLTVSGWTPRPGPRPVAPRVRGQRWADRLQGAVAASILLLTVVFATSVQPTASVEGLSAAYESLDVLADELPGASVEEAVSLATVLISERAMLSAASFDVSALDAQIARTIAPILTELSPEVALALREVLGDLLVQPSPTPSSTATIAPTPEPAETEPPPGSEPPATEAPEPPVPTTGTPTPSPVEPSPSPTQTETETPSPSPSDSPSPTPTDSPTPSPSVTPSPSPSESASPTPTDSPTPSPSVTPSPSPSESPSPTPTVTTSPTETNSPTGSPTPSEADARAKGGNEMLAVVPPGLVLLLGSSGAARWLSRRRR